MTPRPVQLSPELTAIPGYVEELIKKIAEIVKFKGEISNLSSQTHENVSTFNKLLLYFSSIESAVNILNNQIQDIIPSRKEMSDDHKFFGIIADEQRALKGQVTKMANNMLLLKNWCKRITVVGSGGVDKENVDAAEPSVKQPQFDRESTEMPSDPKAFSKYLVYI